MTKDDRRELRNFQRFLRLWPTHGFDMWNRPRWQKYLGLSNAEVAGFNRALLPNSPQFAFFPTPKREIWCARRDSNPRPPGS
jgi:hypothetical protein